MDSRSEPHRPPDGPPAWLENPSERLLWPMGLSTFLNQVWQRQPCVLGGRGTGYYADILATADIDAIICTSDPNAPEPSVVLLRCGETGQELKSIPRTPRGTPNLRFFYQAYAEGYSLRINTLQQRWRPISQFCAAIQQTLRHPVGAYLFLTPPGGQAAPQHYDAHDTFILQIDGAKHWKVYNPVLSQPVRHMEQLVPNDQLGEPLLERCLEAGDLLYMPRGYVHEARTSDTASLHLTLAVLFVRWVDLLKNALECAAERDASVREAISVDFLGSETATEAMKQRFHELAGRILQEVRFEDALEPLARRYAGAQTMPLDGHFVSLNQMGDIGLGTVVRRRTGILCTVSQTDEHVVLWFSGNPIQAPFNVEPALRFVARTERFAVRELPDCLGDEGKVVLVRRLVREGLLAVDQLAT